MNGMFFFSRRFCNQIILFQLRYVSWYWLAACLYMLSAKGFSPVSCMMSCLVLQCCVCVSDPCIVLNASSLPACVSHGEIDAHRVFSSTLCLGMAQSYLDRKLHITTTPFTSGCCLTALNTLLAIA